MLVADDSLQMRRLLLAMLNAIGVWKVRTAGDGREAIAAIKAERPDILITDADMGQVGGMELVRGIRRMHNDTTPYLPIVMVTGHSEQSWVEDARDAGVDEFILKPITSASLYSRMAEVILNPRPFVRSEDYAGPDRRRRNGAPYGGPLRRKDDPSVTSDRVDALTFETKLASGKR